jgi:aspartyl-tRNA(Asn)/glutamyl-tRNA(Gln) amidotransferase subunit A
MKLHDFTAAQLSHAFRTKQASPVEALQAIIAQRDAWQPHINAFCLNDDVSALTQARASEVRWHAGAPLDALDGVPVSIKDLILTKGWPTLRGSRTVNSDQAWDVDAPSVARLREAGAVIFGKTTTPEFGCKGTTDNLLTGVTRNPWNLAKTPGGSSGGAAAAVAAGAGPLAIGTDGAGSVRIPSAFCGLFGLKPSFGRVPAFPLSPFGTVAHLGPHSRSVDDAAMLMNVIAKPDARDWTSLPYDARDYRVGLNDGVRGLKVAFSPDLGYVKNVQPEIAAAVRRAAQTFAELGAQVEEISPGFSSPDEIINGLWFAGAATLYGNMTEAQRAQVDPAFRWEAEQGMKLSLLDMQKLHLRRGELGSVMRQFHTRYDLLITPGVSVTAFDAKASNETKAFTAENFLGWTPFSYPFNLTQQPAAVIPCGVASDGLPMSLQIVGPMFGDALVLRAARAFESTREAILPRPLPRA